MMTVVIYLKLQVDFDNSGIILTEPYFNFTSIQENFNEVLFEEYGFQSIMRCNRKLVSASNYILKVLYINLTLGLLSYILYSCFAEPIRISQPLQRETKAIMLLSG